MASVAKRQWEHNGIPNEAWVVRYKDHSGAHRSKQFKLKKQAIEFQRKVERELDDGTHIARRLTRTITDLMGEYLEHMERRASEGQLGMAHVDAQARALRHAKEYMGTRVVADLTWQHVEQYGKWLRQRRCMFFDRKLANGTIALAMTALSRMIAYGVRRGYAARNMVPDAVHELGALPQKPIETFTQIEMRALVSTIENRRPGMARRSQALMRAVVYLGAMCGLRRGEIFALRWEAIDFGQMRVAVAHSLTNRDELKGPKTEAGKRTIPMPGMVAAALEAWRPFAVLDDRGLIFRTAKGSRVTDNSFYSGFWHPLIKRAGMPGVDGRHRHFHATRHFAGSAWLAGGVPLPEVSRLLGHANMGITARIYSHAVAEIHHQAAAMDACAGLLALSCDTQELRKAA